MVAAEKGFDNVVPVLLEAGARHDLVDSKGLSALDKALKKGHSDVVKLIKDAL